MPWPSDWVDLQQGSAANFNAWHAQIRKMGTPPARRFAIVTRTSALSVPHNTTTIIPWESEELDTAAMWSSAQATRIIAPETDLYIVSVQMELSVDSTVGERRITLNVNGTATSWVENRFRSRWPQLTAALRLNANDYVEVAVLQTSGGAMSLTFARCAVIHTRGLTP